VKPDRIPPVERHAAPRTPPTPASVSELRPSNAAGALVSGAAVIVAAAGIWLSTRDSAVLWVAGQITLAFAMVQWFALLHECGHDTLFRTSAWNALVGRFAAFFSVIPFHTWKRVHARHHTWTGWQDVDPTTAALVPRPLHPAERTLTDVCWKLWIPLFSVLYRFNNFWNLPRLLRLFPKSADRRRIVVSLAAMCGAYAATAAFLGPSQLLRIGGVALLLALAAEELLLLSQHTHIPQHLSRGDAVRPFPMLEQEVFTRTLVFPAWLSASWLHIDAHGLHHMYPFVPGYRLREIAYEPQNRIDGWTWVRRVRAMRGEVFLFQNRLRTGEIV